MAGELVDWVFEIDQDLYDEATAVCKRLGTTLEVVTVAFLRFCIEPENRSEVEAFFQKGGCCTKELYD